MLSHKIIIISTFLLFLNFIDLHAKPQNDERIVNGVFQPIIRRQYQAALSYGFSFICGGSILSPRWILTAAHCTKGRDPNPLTVNVGTQNILYLRNAYAVSEIIQHKEFNETSLDNDISLLRIRDPMEFGIKLAVNQIDLQMFMPEVGSLVKVSGYGAGVFNGTKTNELMSAELIILDSGKCKRRHRNLTENMFCTNIPDTNSDSCQGDSGGPLTYDEKLIGIVSYGRGCARKGYPGVYTKVPNYIEWIKEMMATIYIDPNIFQGK